MANPYVGEIRIVAFSFAPAGWAFCNGQLLAIAQNDVLFALLGTTYGGDGVITFNLPDLQGRVPIHNGVGPGLSNYVTGQVSGTENVTLTSNHIPFHNHLVRAAAGGNDTPSFAGMPASGGPDLYATGSGAAPTMNSAIAGSSQPHLNMAPFLAINYVISLFGIFPSQN
jgi:microcystin-dependent protein